MNKIKSKLSPGGSLEAPLGYFLDFIFGAYSWHCLTYDQKRFKAILNIIGKSCQNRLRDMLSSCSSHSKVMPKAVYKSCRDMSFFMYELVEKRHGGCQRVSVSCCPPGRQCAESNFIKRFLDALEHVNLIHRVVARMRQMHLNNAGTQATTDVPSQVGMSPVGQSGYELHKPQPSLTVGHGEICPNA